LLGTGLGGGIPDYLAGALLPAGLTTFSTGLLGEVMIRTCFESQGRRIYAVRETYRRDAQAVVRSLPSDNARPSTMSPRASKSMQMRHALCTRCS